MAIDDQIMDENLEYDINREAAKISALSSCKFMSTSISLVKIYYYPISNK